MVATSTAAPGLVLVVGIPFGLLLACCIVSMAVYIVIGRVRQ